MLTAPQQQDVVGRFRLAITLKQNRPKGRKSLSDATRRGWRSAINQCMEAGPIHLVGLARVQQAVKHGRHHPSDVTGIAVDRLYYAID